VAISLWMVTELEITTSACGLLVMTRSIGVGVRAAVSWYEIATAMEKTDSDPFKHEFARGAGYHNFMRN